MEKIFTYVGIGAVIYFGIPYAYTIHNLFSTVINSLNF
jgi:hypothetical protein